MSDQEEFQEPEVMAEEVVAEEPAVETEEKTEEPVPEETKEKKNIPGSQKEKARRRALEAELAQMRQEIERLKAPVEPAKSTEPTLAQYDSIEEFLEARDRAREAQKQQKELERTWSERERAAREKLDDYDDAFQDFVASRPSRDIVEAVMESPVGPQLVHYLGSNPDELEHIKSLSAKRQVVELGKLEAKLEKPKAEPKKSAAPPPINPVKPTSSALAPKSRFELY